jgi:hypothetical protein
VRTRQMALEDPAIFGGLVGCSKIIAFVTGSDRAYNRNTRRTRIQRSTHSTNTVLRIVFEQTTLQYPTWHSRA